MGARRLGSRIGAGIALAAAAAVLVAAADVPAAPAPTRAEVRNKLNRAYAHEEAAWTLLAEKPPKTRAARTRLAQSVSLLRDVHRYLVAQSATAARKGVEEAIASDIRALAGIAQGNYEDALRQLERARQWKAWADGYFQPERRTASQCGNGLDDDRDRTVDSRYDSGCTGPRDRSEGSRLACSIRLRTIRELPWVEGKCTGPYASLELATDRPPSVTGAAACRWRSALALACLMRDGRANPGHAFRARLEVDSLDGLQARVTDFAGRTQRLTLRQRSRVEVELNVRAPEVAFIVAGQALFRTDVEFANNGRDPLPEGGRLEVTASRAAYVASARDGSRPIECQQLSPTAWFCPLPELQPQATHHWQMFVGTRETGELRLRYAIPVPTRLDPTPNRPVDAAIQVEQR